MKRCAEIFLTAGVVLCCNGCTQYSYNLNATGQKNCYDVSGAVVSVTSQSDSLYGQDANFLQGAALSFKDNGDGTVTDCNTHLTWQQVPLAEGMTWAEAKKYCDELEFAGYSDWRMPTLKELFSISDFSEGWPYIDTTYFKLATGVVGKDEQYWADNKYTGETLEGRDDAAFGVNHVTGHIKAYPAGSDMSPRGEGGTRGSREMPQGLTPDGERSMPPPPLRENDDAPQEEGTHNMGQRSQRPQMGEARGDSTGMQHHRRPQMGAEGQRPMGNPMAKQVRAVRGNAYGENKFVDNGDGTVSDNATGLMWAKCDNGEGVEWVEALVFAKESALAGYSDWRLPNVKELQSIVDYSKAPSSKSYEAAIDARFFECTPTVNEAGDSDFGYYWTGTSACFRKGAPFYFAWYVAFGRAVNNAGIDMHGAGAVRFDSKSDNGLTVEGGEERYYNFVRLVRNISAK
ncbi:MAG: DUF1566 domain-containing protein [Rikenellaceae bacterium]